MLSSRTSPQQANVPVDPPLTALGPVMLPESDLLILAWKDDFLSTRRLGQPQVQLHTKI